MSKTLHAAFEAEMTRAAVFIAAGDDLSAWNALERAHILGQHGTRTHLRAHWAMLRFGRRKGDRREVRGQMSRLIGALLFTHLWVPEGNTGGANVSALKPMPIAEDLRRILDSAEGRS